MINQSGAATPRFKIKKNRLFSLKMIGSLLFLALLIIGGGAGYYLTQVNQDVRQQAAVPVAYFSSPVNSFEELEKTLASNPKIMDTISPVNVCCQQISTGKTTSLSGDLCTTRVMTDVRVIGDYDNPYCESLSGFGCCQKNNKFEWLTKYDCSVTQGNVTSGYATQASCRQANTDGNAPVSPETQYVCCADSYDRHDLMPIAQCQSQGFRIAYGTNLTLQTKTDGDTLACMKLSKTCCQYANGSRTIVVDKLYCTTSGGNNTAGSNTNEAECAASAPNICCGADGGVMNTWTSPANCATLSNSRVLSEFTTAQACQDSSDATIVCCQNAAGGKSLMQKNTCLSPMINGTVIPGYTSSDTACKLSTLGTNSVCCYDPANGNTSWISERDCKAKADTIKSYDENNCNTLSGFGCCKYGTQGLSWTSKTNCRELFNGSIDSSKTTAITCSANSDPTTVCCYVPQSGAGQIRTKAVCEAGNNGQNKVVAGAATQSDSACTASITCDFVGANNCVNGLRCTASDVVGSKRPSGGSCNSDNIDTGGNNIGATCTQLSQECGSERGAGFTDTCCGNGVCQGTSGQRICQDPGVTGDSICGAGGTCSAYYGFKCDSLATSATSNGALVCEKNGQLYTGAQARSQALAHAGQCGQIDKVCVGGNKPGTLCGEFQIITNSCTGPTPPPATPLPTPTPTPTPPPVVISCNSECTSDAQCQASDSRFTCYTGSTGAKNCRLNSNPTSSICQPASGPMCLSIRMNNITRPTNTIQDPTLGDSVSLTCGTVSLAQRYIFRVVQPDGTISNLTATGPTSAAFTISQAGPYAAQCQICTGAEASTCLPYEPISYTPVN